MRRDVHFQVDHSLIEAARKIAARRKTTLADEFARWIESYGQSEPDAEEALRTLERIASYADSGGRTFSRDERNER